jgi:hypothetical protein
MLVTTDSYVASYMVGSVRHTLDGVQDANSEKPIWICFKQIESLSWTLP